MADNARWRLPYMAIGPRRRCWRTQEEAGAGFRIPRFEIGSDLLADHPTETRPVAASLAMVLPS